MRQWRSHSRTAPSASLQGQTHPRRRRKPSHPSREAPNGHSEAGEGANQAHPAPLHSRALLRPATAA